MLEQHFLWPKGNACHALSQSARLVSTKRIEERLACLFPGSEPVLLSSARAALTLSLLVRGMQRQHRIGMFPYASHCVLEAVSRVATPVAGRESCEVPLVYHQWGYQQEFDLAPHAIEDCVDTLVRPGAPLFVGGGEFEIWSLPKIFGTTGGGVLWCRSLDTAEKVRSLRDSRTGASLQWMMRLLGRRSEHLHAWWHGGEGRSGKASALQTGEILQALERWPSFWMDRKAKRDALLALAPDWLPRSDDRLPCAVPVSVTEAMLPVPSSLGLLAGVRTFERVDGNGHRSLIKVLPIPIHHEVSSSFIRRAMEWVESTTLRRDHQ